MVIWGITHKATTVIDHHSVAQFEMHDIFAESGLNYHIIMMSKVNELDQALLNIHKTIDEGMGGA